MNHKEKPDLGIYIHIPFCVRKCLYCDFLSFPINKNSESEQDVTLSVQVMNRGGSLCGIVAEEAMREYASALVREIRGYEEAVAGRKVRSIFFGGGTPSLMPSESLEELFRALYGSFEIAEDAEITMEMNPGTVDERRLATAFRHINRASVGVQSFCDEELKRIGRIHTAEEADRTFRLLRACGIGNINLDLMYALPGQTVGSFRETLLHAKELAPEHLSVYSLIIEEGTPFGNMAEEGILELPGEEAEMEMADLARELLCGKSQNEVQGQYESQYEVPAQCKSQNGVQDQRKSQCDVQEQSKNRIGAHEHSKDRMRFQDQCESQNGVYEHYEISNFAKEGFRCRHNVRYWKRGDYLGFGLGASSLFDGCRWSNTREMREYLRESGNPRLLRRNFERLSERSAMEEFMFLGLRMTEGVKNADFRRMFGKNLSDVYGGTIQKHISEGVMIRTPGGVALTQRGLEVSNVILADYLMG